ncbi:MAG: hypothetical protein LC664_10610 [Flavobacteriales bacterium]|nr:hypothetical protein [Flavobacteriales bacterium]
MYIKDKIFKHTRLRDKALVDKAFIGLINKGYPQEVFHFPPRAYLIENATVQPSLTLIDDETGNEMAVLCESHKITQPRKHYWDKYAPRYAEAIKNPELRYFLIFQSTGGYVQFLERVSNEKWLPISLADFYSYEDLKLRCRSGGTGVQIESWPELNDVIQKIHKKYDEASDTHDFKGVALAVRDVYEDISRLLHKMLTNPDQEIVTSKTDMNGNLEAFCKLYLSGKQNEKLRPLVKKAKEYTNDKIHKTTSNRSEIKLAVLSVSFLAALLEEIVKNTEISEL